MTRTTFTGRQTNEISFPLGGIGTGSIGLAGNGRLIDWEIFNRPNKGSVNGHTHFAVKAMKDGRLVDARILNGDVYKDLAGQMGDNFGKGLNNATMQGFPHFRDCTFTGEFPLAVVELADPDAACTAKVTAFNPLIPHNDRDSSIPAGFFEITVTNITDETLDFSVSGTLKNPKGESVNRYFEQDGVKGIYLDGAPLDKSSPDHTDMTLATIADDVSYQEYWYRGSWFDGLETYWRNFTEQERFTNRSYDGPGKGDCANLCTHKTVKPGESFTVRYIIAWYSPIKPDQWKYGDEQPMEVRNYYSYLFEDSRAAAVYSLTQWERLYGDTKRWHDELFASTLPEEVVEAVSATMSVLKTETSIRIGEKGNFYGWEGLNEHSGSCEGTCTHVWNYAYVMAFLFPELERGIRENDYVYNQKPSGEMVFRTRIPFGRGIGGFRACVDGQMGGVIKVWREWKLCGNNDWLKSIWPEVKKSLEFAWSEENHDRWDRDKDGVLEGRQHHTLDMELFGPSSWLEGFYLGALKAGAEMAEAMGEPEAAKEYLALFEKGRAWCAENLFNGEYFDQKVDLADKAMLESFGALNYWNEEAGQIKYQIGEGCEIDQLLAQWHADIIGLGELFDPEQVKTALANMYKNNFKETMRGHYNTFRLFAMNDEAGAIICDYPEGAVKPAIPIPYAQESMHGFEYAFAGLLMSRGFIDEGLRVVRSIRDRYRGDNRNPWNEIECGSNYARSMASFALLPILSGMKFDLTKGLLGFDPIVSRDGFRCVWSVGEAWGNVQIGGATRIEVAAGKLTLANLALPYMDGVRSVEVDGKAVSFTVEGGVIVLNEPVSVEREIIVK
ncbi:MAG: hypothetical protein IJ493_08890 [Clostridia bacterium]|nr:hypothetical protein [Clostridia bacterium]